MTKNQEDSQLPTEFIMIEIIGRIVRHFLYFYRSKDSWDQYTIKDYKWYYDDNVGDATAREAYNSEYVYVRVKR